MHNIKILQLSLKYQDQNWHLSQTQIPAPVQIQFSHNGPATAKTGANPAVKAITMESADNFSLLVIS
jgi:hypothetical protein